MYDGYKMGIIKLFFCQSYCPFFLSKLCYTFYYFFSTQRIGMKLHTNVHINMWDGYTKGGSFEYFYFRIIAPFLSIFFSNKAMTGDTRAPGSTPF